MNKIYFHVKSLGGVTLEWTDNERVARSVHASEPHATLFRVDRAAGTSIQVA